MDCHLFYKLYDLNMDNMCLSLIVVTASIIVIVAGISNLSVKIIIFAHPIWF